MTDRDEHHNAILRALDLSIQRAAKSRGLEACDGREAKGVECEVGELHTKAAAVAAGLAQIIEDPTSLDVGEMERRIDAFSFSIAKAFAGKPKLS